MGKFNKLSIIIITLMVCIFGSLIVYFALFKNNDDVNVNIDNSNNIFSINKQLSYIIYSQF